MRLLKGWRPKAAVKVRQAFAMLAAIGTEMIPSQAAAQTQTPVVPVTVLNFVRAETDMYMARAVKDGGFGKFAHTRELAPLDNQSIIRMNRDTLYSQAVFDLDAGPVTITLPDAGKRFMSMAIISEDEYSPPTVYAPGTTSLTKQSVGTRYVLIGVRTLLNPTDPNDLQKVHALQDAITVAQPNGPGTFEIPSWDPVSQKKVRDALLVLAEGITDTSKSYGSKEQVDPIAHLVDAAAGWGGNPPKDATYLSVTPSKNDGKTVYHLTVKDVPVDGFWSISVYNSKGYYEKNPYDSYTINNLTVKLDQSGSAVIQFGGCDGKIPNCIPTMPGWNYAVRLYLPRASILDGSWKFPEAQPV
jgi:hypothetical protein